MTNLTNPIVLNLDTVQLTDEQFFQLCLNNHELQFERNANGDLTIMPPTGGETSYSNAGLTAQLWVWNESSQLGKVFDSSGGFKLPNGADRSPDVAWIPNERWDALVAEQRAKFLPLCPDFAIELRSKSDTLAALRRKMEEYRDNGTRLGWLLDRVSRSVEIYRPGQAVERLENPATLSGEDVLPGFILNLPSIW
ncbi:MAG: Uma2 family endonuclease [Cyanobacteriota bacterium]|nr:Uma2 family endonuclease [Cyanobacteriota bacterium]